MMVSGSADQTATFESFIPLSLQKGSRRTVELTRRREREFRNSNFEIRNFNARRSRPTICWASANQ
jgi:hypothetical protein